MAFLALMPAYLTIRESLRPTTELVQAPSWGWVHWAEWDYSVFLRPNTVFGTEELGPGQTYYNTLVDSIEARFSYDFATDVPARITGWYEVTTTLAVGELPGERVLVVPRIEFAQEEGSQASVALTVPVDRQVYRDRVQEILSETGVQTRVDATVTYVAHVEVAASAAAGTVQEVLEPTLTLPLGQEAFSITGDRALRDSGVVYQSEVRPIPDAGGGRWAWLAVTALSTLLLGFSRGTVPRTAEADPLGQEARRLRRKYRKRIAHAGPGAADLPGGEVVAVASMDDLARVSEELLKPIIYANSSSQGGAHLFYIVDGSTRYEYRLSMASPGMTPNPALPIANGEGPGEGRTADPPIGEVVVVASMDGLARMAQELGQPIIYASFDSQSGTHLYYLVDGAIRYEYRSTVLS